MIALAVVLWGLGLFTLYLAYCTIWEMKRNGRWDELPWIVKGVVSLILLMAVIVDVSFNFVLGSVIFLELPHYRRPTFTARCSYHMHASSWRGRIARWFCYGWMNPFRKGHCH